MCCLLSTSTDIFSLFKLIKYDQKTIATADFMAHE